jgi:hypothetical protein
MRAPEGETRPFAYSLLRVVPRVERGERLNVGVVLFCRQLDFLDICTHLDEARLAAIAPDADPAPIRARLEALAGVARGDAGSGPIGGLSQSERFGWIVAPASTVIQHSKVHTGLTHDPAVTLAQLYARLVA